MVRNFPHPPGQGQSEAIRHLSQYLLNGNERDVFLLKGYAGTGKTVLVSAFINSLPRLRVTCVLLAPTGRAAKVLGNFSGKPAQTIHKKIYKKDLQNDGSIHFSLAENTHENCVFIVDEASMIGAGKSDQVFGDLLDNLFEYVFSGKNCRLILIGDSAQLPPVGSDESPALDKAYLERNYHLNLVSFELSEVLRQSANSQILLNAFKLREAQTSFPVVLAKLNDGNDVIRILGDMLEDSLHESIRKYGEEEVIIVTRSNKRAKLYNQNMRNRILFFEEALCSGDRLMVVKNNYFWLDEKDEIGFIANGEQIQITKIVKHENKFGYDFYDCLIRLCDYPERPAFRIKLNAGLLYSDEANLSTQAQNTLLTDLLKNEGLGAGKYERMNLLRKNPYFNALHVKFSYAVTCHKAQGGQWSAVYLDPGFLNSEQLDKNYLRWLYTAFTRSKEKLYLMNFGNEFFD